MSARSSFFEKGILLTKPRLKSQKALSGLKILFGSNSYEVYESLTLGFLAQIPSLHYYTTLEGVLGVQKRELKEL